MPRKSKRQKLKGGDEWDAVHRRSRQICGYLHKAGVKKAIRKKINKRARQEAKKEKDDE